MSNKSFDPLSHGVVPLLKGDTFGSYECPEYVEALLHHLLREIGRIFWNMHQRKWDMQESPQIAAVHFLPYYWGDSDDPDYDRKAAASPNFAFGDAEIRWYKYPGRGMSVNVDWAPDRWCAWFDQCWATIQKAEPHLIHDRKRWEEEKAKYHHRRAQFFGTDEEERSELQEYQAVLESLVEKYPEVKTVLDKWRASHSFWRALTYAFVKGAIFQPSPLFWKQGPKE